ncbi:unnamed protein product [Trifolium pratense]|uniref:Uncharacterized protein n=1 Tax=Trifolium pratense TaxID=57577 RepID=A0ACB0K9G0_TRIPR|nr:unnamed protein product [Trifolium pratense]
MRPKEEDILEAYNSAKTPHNMQEGKVVSNDAQMVGPQETKLLQAEIFERLARSEAENGAKFDKIFAALDILIDQTPSKHHHGAGLNNNRPPFQVRNVKLEFPRFDGKNVHEWIFRAEQFFEYYDTPDPDRLTIASVHLDKDVVPWYQMMQRTHPFMSWIELTRALELDFGPSIYECPRATLFKLNQTGSVADYYLQFTSLANRVYGLSNDALVDCFVSGLSNEIRRDVLIHTPPSLVKAVSLAKCPNRQLMLLQYDDNEEENVVEIPSDSSDVAINTLETTQPEHHLSFNAMKGNSSMGILRFSGTIEHIQVQILIDGGSSDNFLQPRIARFLKLPIEPGPVFKVLVGNGEIMTAEGVIQNLALNIQGTELQVPVFLLPVAGADVILGASWLATLGPHVADYASLTLKFFINGKFVTLQGEATPRPAAAQFHHFKRLHYTDAIAECFTIQWLKSHTDEDIFRDLPTNIEPEIAILLHTYKELFKTPNTLPPHRSHNHSIPLIEGHNPVKFWSRKRMAHGAKFFSKLDLRSGYHQILLQPEDRYKTTFRTHQGLYECSTWQDHLSHLDTVLKTLLDNDLFVKLSKCSFGVSEIEYLGHLVTGQGVSMDRDKIKAVLEWPIPKNIKQLRGFLGLTGYYRRFIKHYARLAAPLTDLLKKENYNWNAQTELAFQELKAAMTSAPVLALPNFQKPFILETDASGVGVGAVLHQDGHPIAYFSKKLVPRNQKKSAYFREMLAISEAIAKFRHYLLGHRFIIRTDQKSLRSLMDQSLQTPEQQQWLHKFLGYDFVIEYKPGKENLAADALSRVMTLAWTLARIKSQFYWVAMKKDVLEYIQNCVICQQAKTTNTLPAGLLQPLPIPTQVWEDIAMDFITGLPLSYGYTTILVVVDRLTKYAHFLPMKTDYSSKSVAEVFMNRIVKLHGMPKSIVSDRDKVFTSSFWQHLFKLQGTSLAMSSAYHPQSDGQTEVLNKGLELFLRCFTFNNPKSWYKALAWSEFWYNTALHTSIGMTPFKALYGREPPTLTRYEAQDSDPPALQEELKERDRILQQLKSNLERAQQYMKKQADKHIIEVKFQLGDLVLVKLQPYRQQSVALRKNQKLGMRYFGPFEIIACVGKVACKLKLPDHAKIHPVFHVSQLKPFKGVPQQQYMPLPLTMSDNGPMIQQVEILQVRTIMKGTQRIYQAMQIVIVLWKPL